MQNMFSDKLLFLGDLGFDPLNTAASCFAAGSDKTGTVDKDEVVYINGFIDCIGINPILNEHENKWYFRFSDPLGNGQAYSYDREYAYGNRWIQIRIFDTGNNTYEDVEVTVLEAMEDRGLFTERWDDIDVFAPVDHFAQAVDDAVQVLDYVHGDSNIEFLPGGPTPNP